MKKLVACLICLLCSHIAIAAEIGPEQLIRQTSVHLLAEIKANSERYHQDPTGLYALVEEVVLPYFDFNSMTNLALDRYRHKVTMAQRPQIIREFRVLLVRTYTRALLDYTDQEIIYLPSEVSQETGNVTVKTEIEQEGGFPIPLDYSLHPSDQGWKVYDISVDNVSLVLNYRSSFARQIRKHGIEGLIQSLRDRNQDFGQ